jgi:hypothetical protein
VTSRVRRAAFLIGVVLAVYAGISACQVVGGYKSFEEHPCSVLPSSRLDQKGLVTLELSKQSDGTCYWIDKTEVTVQQYSQFLADPQAQTMNWPPVCTWKTTPSNPAGDTSDSCAATISLSGEDDPFYRAKPIRCVDWCDAWAFCNWAGKNLCDGNSYDQIVTPQNHPDLWGGACSSDAVQYVHGSMPVYAECNVGLDAGDCHLLVGQYVCAPTAVDSFPRCASPSGAVDMIGNVAEWVLQCGDTPDDGGAEASVTQCQQRGGSFASSLTGSTCYAIANGPRQTRDRSVGLRCCADLTPNDKRLLNR